MNRLLKLFTNLRARYQWRKTIRETWPTWAAFTEAQRKQDRDSYLRGYHDGYAEGRAKANGQGDHGVMRRIS
jgi:hypothetical protein